MAEYIVNYTNDRASKIAEQEALGRQMLHDHFTETGGVMTFIDPIPPTADEIAEKLAEERADAMMAELKQSFKDGAYPLWSKPATGEKRVKSVHTDSSGNIKITRET